MLRRYVVKIAWFVLLVCLSMAQTAFADLNSEIQSVLNDKLLQKAQVGISVVRLGAMPSQPVYESQSHTPLIPASNLKLVTTSAALARLGPQFNFRTMLLVHDGDLIVLGDGDPTLGDWELLRRYGMAVDTTFTAWADALKERGIERVRNVIVDDSIFDQQWVHPGWPADQVLNWYEAEVGGLNLNANVLDFYVQITSPGQPVRYTTNPRTNYAAITNQCVTGTKEAVWFTRTPQTNQITLRGEAKQTHTVPVAITIHDPGMYAGTVLSETLKNNGIQISGRLLRDTTARQRFSSATAQQKTQWQTVAILETPIQAVLNRTNKDSMNLYAEALCKRIGYAVSQEGSWKAGTAAIGTFLESMGIPGTEFTLDDGSGLSRENRISAEALTKLLAHDFNADYKQIFIDSLSVAGSDGTLDNRFVGMDLRGRVFAKSGYIRGVSSLSGYLQSTRGDWYAFSILMNGVPGGMNSAAKLLQEKIIHAIDQAIR